MPRPALLIVSLLAVAPALAAPEAHGLDDAALTDLARDTSRDATRLSKKLARLYRGQADRRKVSQRDTTVERWAVERDRALALIFDTTIYPDENHGAAGQSIVDAQVERVRAAWAPLDHLQRRDLKTLLKLDPDEAASLLGQLGQLRDRLGDLRALQTERGLEASPELTVAPAIESLLRQRAGDASGAEALHEAMSAYDRALVARLDHAQVCAGNAAWLRGRNVEAGERPTASEVAQVQLTNDYRLLLGRAALRLDPRLVASARGHSADMTRLDFFAHESPVAGKEGAGDRMSLAGYPSPGGENIYKGGRSPEAAHDGWYHSSGHHRNLLSPSWTAIGAGQDGDHWTQNFGR